MNILEHSSCKGMLHILVFKLRMLVLCLAVTVTFTTGEQVEFILLGNWHSATNMLFGHTFNLLFWPNCRRCDDLWCCKVHIMTSSVCSKTMHWNIECSLRDSVFLSTLAYKFFDCKIGLMGKEIWNFIWVFMMQIQY